MDSIFGGKPKVDDSGLKRQEALLKQQEARATEEERLRKEQLAAKAKAQGGQQGTSSLLSGLDTGVAPVSGGKRTSLG